MSWHGKHVTDSACCQKALELETACRRECRSGLRRHQPQTATAALHALRHALQVGRAVDTAEGEGCQGGALRQPQVSDWCLENGEIAGNFLPVIGGGVRLSMPPIGSLLPPA